MDVLTTGGRARPTRGRVLQGALAVVDAEGLDALTMRRLGQELDCDRWRCTGTRTAARPC